MGSNANPVQTRAETSVVFELTLAVAAGAGSDALRKKTFALDRSLRIGADPANHIVIDGEGVGAFHARFFPGPIAPVFVCSDGAASINGMEIRGSAGLIAGDVLSIGDYEVTVSVQGARAERSAGTAARWQLILDDDVASVQVSSDAIIGSEADCGIRLPEGGIAGHHAQLVLRDGALWLRDFSDGATFVNDDPVRGACRLEPEDRIRIGPHRFRAARQPRTAVEPVAAASVTPAAPDLDSLRSEVPAARDIPTTAEAKAEAPRPAMPVADAPVAEARVSAAQTPVPKVPVSVAPVARKKPVAKTPAADKPEPAWEFDSLEMPVAEIHFELVEPETPRVVPEPIPQPAPPPQVSRRPVVPERRVLSVGVEPRVSTGRPARPRADEPTTRRTSLWRVAGLLVALTLAWAVAMRPSAYDGLAGRAFEGWTFADARDRALATARAVQTAIVDRWRVAIASSTATASESASAAATPALAGVPASASDPMANGKAPQPTADIIELQRNAAAGDATAIAHLNELGDFYAALASSAQARGDHAAATRHLGMAALMRSQPSQAEGTAAATTESAPRPSQDKVSPADALAQEARRLQSQGAVFAPAQRNVVSVLVEALRLDPTHQGARRHLDLVIGSLNGRIATLIANHQFNAAGSLLAQLADDGVPVLSNGNVRDRPPFLDAQAWRALAVSSLLVEADALIQQGLIATVGNDNAISRLESATRIDPTNPLIEDMRAKSAGMLFLDAQRAAEYGRREEARRLTNLANYVRDGFGA